MWYHILLILVLYDKGPYSLVHNIIIITLIATERKASPRAPTSSNEWPGNILLKTFNYFRHRTTPRMLKTVLLCRQHPLLGSIFVHSRMPSIPEKKIIIFFQKSPQDVCRWHNNRKGKIPIAQNDSIPTSIPGAKLKNLHEISRIRISAGIESC